LLSLIFEIDFSISGFLAGESTFMNKVMMVPAEQHQVVQTGVSPVGPVFDVMSIDESGVRAARKATTIVSNAQCTPHRGWNRPRTAPDR
jgi:hypothetical protein